MKILTTLTLITITMTVLGQTGPQSSQGSSNSQGGSSQGGPVPQTALTTQTSSDLQVIDFGWTQHVTGPSTNVRIEDSSNAPVARPEPRSSTLRQTVPERLERIRDTNARMSDLHSLESEARASQVESTYSTPRPYYEYHVRVRNAGGKQIQSVYWQYEIEHLDGQEPFVRQVFCKSKLKSEEVKQLKLYSFSSPRKVIKVSNREGAAVIKGDEHVVINRIEFSDGSLWQRPDWIATIVPAQFVKKVGGGQCLGL